MGIFTANSLTIDQAVDITTYVTIMGILSYLTRGGLLSAAERSKVFEQRLKLHDGNDASTWRKSKLCVAADDVARLLISNPTFLRILDESGWQGNMRSKSDREVNEEIAATVRRILFARELV
jgi:hypothetical protein